MDLLVLDFDGPLFDGRAASQKALIATYGDFASKWGWPSYDFSGSPLYGPAETVGISYTNTSIDRAELLKIESVYRQHLRLIEDSTPIAANVIIALRKIAATGCRLGILSSRIFAELEMHLQANGMADLFAFIAGSDSVPTPKPHPDALHFVIANCGAQPKESVFVGDSDSDFECARSAGVAYYHAGWTQQPSFQSKVKCEYDLARIEDLVDIYEFNRSVHIQDPRVLPAELVQAAKDKSVTYFGGAGVSVPSGIGDWTSHYLPVLREVGGAFLSREKAVTDVLQLLAADRVKSRMLYDTFKASFERPNTEPNSYHFLLLRAKPRRIWTTNYDALFESAIAKAGFRRAICKDDESLLNNFSAQKQLVKLNGDFVSSTFNWDLDWGVVFTDEQFDLADQRCRELWRLVEDDYRNTSLIFIGLSFNDPALKRIVAWAAKAVPKTRFMHYLLLKAPTHPSAIAEATFQRENFLRRSIQAVYFNDYDDVERFVAEIAITQHRPIVGFSGIVKQSGVPTSADRLSGGQLTSGEIERICVRVGRALAQRGFRVTSGHGPGVGVPAVDSAFAVDPTIARFYLRRHGTSNFSRTAPAVVVPGNDLAQMRDRFVSELSILIAIGGEVLTEPTSGTVSELELALNRRVPVLLIPQGGGDVLAYSSQLPAKLKSAFSGSALERTILQANQKIAALTAAELEANASTILPELISQVLAESMKTELKLQPELIGRDFADEW